jgi:signal peptidase I
MSFTGFRLTIVTGVVVLIAFFLLLPVFVSCVEVSSNSMSPTLQTGTYIAVETFCARVSKRLFPRCDIRRGDVVVFERIPETYETSNDSGLTVKRIVGLSGDRVRIVQGNVIVNNQLVPEPYVKWTNTAKETRPSWPIYNHGPLQDGVLVPLNSAFVLGDNRYSSVDSRVFGPIRREDIVGHVLFSVNF